MHKLQYHYECIPTQRSHNARSLLKLENTLSKSRENRLNETKMCLNAIMVPQPRNLKEDIHNVYASC